MTTHDLNEDREQSLAEERLVYSTQTLIQRELNKRGLKYRDLARRLGVSEARISQLMGDDAHNLTVRTLARILYRLGEVGEFMTEREINELKGNTIESDTSTWVFAAPVGHFYGGEDDSDVIFEISPSKESSDDWREWVAAEAAAAGRMRIG